MCSKPPRALPPALVLILLAAPALGLAPAASPGTARAAAAAARGTARPAADPTRPGGRDDDPGPGPTPDPDPGPTPDQATGPTPDATWDALADCESDGDWQADTGNGYYGGLQIWPPTWREADGLRFADRPDRATRREQITVAETILATQGWRAWSACARTLGLLRR
ncbi:transglycosylase family protein [Kitasatospora paranensis]|uniref:Transglycosylase family protein n=1 Tax=Kitasatospora paranensis TaxID=258053 RepID=A0ABW2FMH8_9ACTN